MHTRTQGKSSDFIGAWARPTCGSWRVSSGGRGELWFTVGTRKLEAEVPGNIHQCEFSWGLPFGTKTWPHPTACWFQHWDARGQKTNRVGTQLHPSADRLAKDFPSPKLTLDVPLDTALPTRGPRPNSTHQWAGTSQSCQEPAQTSRSASCTRGKHKKQESYYPGHCRTESANTD